MDKPIITKNSFEYVAKVSRMGDKTLLLIPLKYHEIVEDKFGSNEVVVTVEETSEEPENTRIPTIKKERKMRVPTTKRIYKITK